MEAEKQADTGLKTKTIPLSTQGAELPLGLVAPDGSCAKDIATRPWRMKEERELGALRDQNRDSNVAQYVGMVLSTMCSKLGHNDFEAMKFQERRVIVSQMFVADVFYAYIWLRIQAMGADLTLNMACPACRHKFPYVADLNTLEVTVAENLDEAKWEYKLKVPFRLRGDNITRLLLGPSRWTGLEMMQGGGALNTGAAKAGIIRGSIHGLPDKPDKGGKPMPISLAESELDEMSKRDLESLTAQIDSRALGPNMAVEGKCDRCRTDYKMPLDWGYDSFFGDSSR